MLPGFFCLVHCFETDIDELRCMSKLLKCIAAIKDVLPRSAFYRETENIFCYVFLVCNSLHTPKYASGECVSTALLDQLKLSNAFTG